MNKKWKTLLFIVWVTQVMSLMSFSFGVPFLPFYIQDLGVVDPDKVKLITGVLSAAPAIGMGIMAPIWGILSDKIGKKPMLIRAIASSVVVLLGLGLVNSVNGLIIFRIVQGFLTGTVTAASALIASETPDEHMSYALGILSSSTFIGFSIGPALGGILAETVGYQFSFILGGILMFINLIVVLLFVKESKKEVLKEEKKSKIKLKYILTPLILLTLSMVFFIRLGRTFPSAYMALYIKELRGVVEGSALMTGLITAATSVVTAISALTLSRLGDKYNKQKLIMIYLTIGIILTIPLILTNNLTYFAIFYILVFFAIGGIEPLTMAYAVTLVPDNRRGTLFGLQGMVSCMAWAIGPMVGSYTTIHYGLKSVFIFMPIFLFFGIVTAFFMKKVANK